MGTLNISIAAREVRAMCRAGMDSHSAIEDVVTRLGGDVVDCVAIEAAIVRQPTRRDVVAFRLADETTVYATRAAARAAVKRRLGLSATELRSRRVRLERELVAGLWCPWESWEDGPVIEALVRMSPAQRQLAIEEALDMVGQGVDTGTAVARMMSVLVGHDEYAAEIEVALRRHMMRVLR